MSDHNQLHVRILIIFSRGSMNCSIYCMVKKYIYFLDIIYFKLSFVKVYTLSQ